MAIVKRIIDIPVLSISGQTGLPNGFGFHTFGVSKLADRYIEAGIYRRNTRHRNNKIVKMKHYVPTNPQTTAQQTRRTKFANGVAQWHLLTNDQKWIYRKKGAKLNMTGFNLFMRQWMFK